MKKRNEDNPDIQEDKGEELSAEELKELNRLLERLHQADYNTLGSIVLNVYKPGSWHVDNVENQNFYGEKWAELPKTEKHDLPVLPEALSSEEAMALWERVQKAGYVDTDFQPTISRTQAALLADSIATRLGIKEKWKAFETLWNRKNMYRDYYEALNQKKSLEFQDELKMLFH